MIFLPCLVWCASPSLPSQVPIFRWIYEFIFVSIFFSVLWCATPSSHSQVLMLRKYFYVFWDFFWISSMMCCPWVRTHEYPYGNAASRDRYPGSWYVCIYICIYIHIYIYICEYLQTHLHICIYIYVMLFCLFLFNSAILCFQKQRIAIIIEFSNLQQKCRCMDYRHPPSTSLRRCFWGNRAILRIFYFEFVKNIFFEFQKPEFLKPVDVGFLFRVKWKKCTVKCWARGCGIQGGEDP